MNRSLRIRLAALATVAMVALVSAAVAAAEDYEPFVTDFPKGPAPVEPYRPFVTDFGIEPRAGGGGFTSHARASQADRAWTGEAWGDVALGGAIGIAFAALVAAAGLGVRSARQRGGSRQGVALEPQGTSPR